VVGSFAQEGNLAFVDDVDEVALVAVLEEHLAGLEYAAALGVFGWCSGGDELDGPVGQGDEALVVGGDHDRATGDRQFSNDAQDLFDLYVVEVGGGFVGEHERGLVHERPGDGHALLLTA
jgi:hypothetical protein